MKGERMGAGYVTQGHLARVKRACDNAVRAANAKAKAAEEKAHEALSELGSVTRQLQDQKKLQDRITQLEQSESDLNALLLAEIGKRQALLNDRDDLRDETSVLQQQLDDKAKQVQHRKEDVAFGKKSHGLQRECTEAMEHFTSHLAARRLQLEDRCNGS